MSELTKAFVIGGFSEDHDFLEALTRAVSEGSGRLVDEAESITLAEGFANAEAINNEAANRMVLGHSAAMLVMRRAGLVVAMNGVEPTPLRTTIKGALRVANNHEIGREDHVAKPGVINGFREVLKHPTTLKTPFLVRKFSTVQSLIQGGPEAFPEGRLYLPTRNDEFGFGSYEDVVLAEMHGITAKMLDGYHNQPLLHPLKVVEQISDLLNQTS